MNKKIFLIEIKTEELPAKEINFMSEVFSKNFKKKIKIYPIKYKKLENFSTPRRLSIKITDILYTPKEKYIFQKGPSIKESFNDKNQLTEIAINWSKKFKTQVESKNFYTKKKQKYLIYKKKKKSLPLEDIFKKIVLYTTKKIPSKKTMHWDQKNIFFSRPIRNITVLLDENIIPIKIFNLYTTRYSYGHFLMGEKKIYLNHAKEYTKELFKKYYVIIDQKDRKNYILKKIKKLSEKKNKLLFLNQNLLEEITSLVEWPIILLGKFDKKFLKISSKILTYIIEIVHKSFPLFKKDNKKITNHFIIVINTPSKNIKKIILENQQVLQFQLENINFFMKKDLKISLKNRIPLLKKITFQNNLGTLYDKTQRINILSQYISKKNDTNLKLIQKAALLSKCDLTTNMVNEYPELEGIIGMTYAKINKEPKKIYYAIKDHYLPKTSKDKIPKTLIGCILSLSDKIDTISGLFIINKIPKNNKDPYALRRYAIGIIKIIIKKKIKINLLHLIEKSVKLYKNQENINQKILNIFNFIYSKLISVYTISEYNKKIIKSVLSLKLKNILKIHIRIKFLIYIYKINYLRKIILLYKRIKNFINLENINIINKKIIKEKKIKIISENLENSINILLNEINKNNQYENYKEFSKKLLKIYDFIEIIFKNYFLKTKNSKNYQNILIIFKNINKIMSKICNFSYLE